MNIEGKTIEFGGNKNLMENTKVITHLNEQIKIWKSLISKSRDSQEFKSWKINTLAILEKAFWEKSNNYTQFRNNFLWRSSPFFTEKEYQEMYDQKMKSAITILESTVWKLQEFPEENIDNKILQPADTIETISKLCRNFHLFITELWKRYDSRPSIIIDEYDVQDLFRALLYLHFTDIRPEECTPSLAGNSSRTDFLLKNEETVIEIKMTRKWLDRKETANQLIIDKERYRNHPNCKYLVCFIYDPEWRIWNPIWFENDLNSNDNGLQTIVIVTPKWH